MPAKGKGALLVGLINFPKNSVQNFLYRLRALAARFDTGAGRKVLWVTDAHAREHMIEITPMLRCQKVH